LGPNRAKFGTGMFSLNFMAGFAKKGGWFRLVSGGFDSFHLLVCTGMNQGFYDRHNKNSEIEPNSALHIMLICYVHFNTFINIDSWLTPPN